MISRTILGVSAAAVTGLCLVIGAAGAGDEAVSGILAQNLRTRQSRYQPGEKALFVYTIQNRGDKPLSYTFASTQQYDMRIERAGVEVYRLSRGKFYAAMITSIRLEPGETKTFNICWDQRDDKGRQVEPGSYMARVWLTPMKGGPPEASVRFGIGSTSAAPESVTVREAVRRAAELADRRVIIAATYRGWQPDPDDPNCRPGPPVTRSDWVIADHTGGMYVTGKTELNPSKDVGARIEVVGRLARTPKGQVYLILESALAKARPPEKNEG